MGIAATAYVVMAVVSYTANLPLHPGNYRGRHLSDQGNSYVADDYLPDPDQWQSYIFLHWVSHSFLK